MQLSEFEGRAIEHVLRSHAPGKHAARSALRHLERAWSLKDSMPEVAVFLGITAEEESAAALFLSLKRRKYEGAGALSCRSHVQKTALHPFLLAAGKLLSQIPEAGTARFIFDDNLSPDGIERLRLRITVRDSNGSDTWAHPLPPLEFGLLVNGATHSFGPELDTLATEKGSKSIREYVKRLANRRNQALYAAPNGIPHAGDVLPFLVYRKSVVFSHLMAYLMIDPYSKVQLFPQQCLTAFLSMLQLFPSET